MHAVPERREVVLQDARNSSTPSKRYTFDRVFDTQSKQADLYKHVVAPLVEQVIQGYSCTIFAYAFRLSLSLSKYVYHMPASSYPVPLLGAPWQGW